MPNVDEILESFGVELVQDLQKSLVDKGVTFTGGGASKLSGRIRYEIKQNSDSVVFNLIMPDYSEFVDKGRNPGSVSREGQRSISEWAKRKGIVGKFQNENLATRKKAQENARRKIKTLQKLPFDKALKALTFLVAIKVRKQGYKGNNFYSDVVNDGRIQAFQDQLTAAFKQKVLIEIRS